MKKIVVTVAAALALSSTVPAFAAMQMAGKLNGGFEVWNHRYENLGPEADGSLYIAAKENGGWTAEAEIKNLESAAQLGKYKVEFTDPLFKMTFWGNEKEVAAKSDPLGFIESAAEHDGVLKARATVGPVVVDVQDPAQPDPADENYDPYARAFLFAEKSMDNNTIGLAAHSQLPSKDNGVTVLGYGRTNVSTMTLDGEIGITNAPGVTDKNVGWGVRAAAPLTDNITGMASYKSRPVNFDVTDNDAQGINELYAEAKYTGKNMTLIGSMKDEKGVDLNNMNVAWDDEAVDSQTLTAKAIMPNTEAEVSRVTDLTVSPTNTISVTHSRTIAPALAVTGNVELKSDRDGVQYEQASLADEDVSVKYFNNSNSYAKLAVNGKYTGIKKLTVEPALIYVMGQNDESYTQLGSKAGYQVSPNGKLTAEYAEEHVNGIFADSKLNMGYEVKF